MCFLFIQHETAKMSHSRAVVAHKGGHGGRHVADRSYEYRPYVSRSGSLVREGYCATNNEHWMTRERPSYSSFSLGSLGYNYGSHLLPSYACATVVEPSYLLTSSLPCVSRSTLADAVKEAKDVVTKSAEEEKLREERRKLAEMTEAARKAAEEAPKKVAEEVKKALEAKTSAPPPAPAPAPVASSADASRELDNARAEFRHLAGEASVLATEIRANGLASRLPPPAEKAYTTTGASVSEIGRWCNALSSYIHAAESILSGAVPPVHYASAPTPAPSRYATASAPPAPASAPSHYATTSAPPAPAPAPAPAPSRYASAPAPAPAVAPLDPTATTWATYRTNEQARAVRIANAGVDLDMGNIGKAEFDALVDALRKESQDEKDAIIGIPDVYAPDSLISSMPVTATFTPGSAPAPAPAPLGRTAKKPW